MSIPVTLDELAARVDEFGAACLLITVSDDLRPHATNVLVECQGHTLSSGVGRRTAANADARPLVTLMWNPNEPGGHSLIVDGTATATRSESGQHLSVEATSAILHRSAS